jgi:hypothetical protein
MNYQCSDADSARNLSDSIHRLTDTHTSHVDGILSDSADDGACHGQPTNGASFEELYRSHLPLELGHQADPTMRFM